MKLQFIAVAAAALAWTTQASAVVHCTNFSGEWQGHCLVNGVAQPSSKTIVQEGCETIRIGSTDFSTEVPTETTHEGEKFGRKFKITTIHDFAWDAYGRGLLTSARWLGWYLDGHGSWTGEGQGWMTLDAPHPSLITYRRSTVGEEQCRYWLKQEE